MIFTITNRLLYQGFFVRVKQQAPKETRETDLTRNLIEIARSEMASFFILFHFTFFLPPVHNFLDKPCGFAIIQARKRNEITE